VDSWEACSVAAVADQAVHLEKAAPLKVVPVKEDLLKVAREKVDPVNGAKVGPRDVDRVVVALVDQAAVRVVGAWNSIRSSA
jgi:hypothetical protein